MLFDLRGRGRRRTVQGVYLGLALLMGGGLVLFGVGAGNGFGGILDAFTGQGSNNSKPVVSQAETNAVRQTQLRPNDPAAWAALVQARDSAAKQEFNSSTGTITANGQKKLAQEVAAWQHYLTLTKNPDGTTSLLAARAYGLLSDYRNEASAWEAAAVANPSDPKNYECLAASAYAAKQSRKGDLAAAKAQSLVPKAQRLAIKQQIQQAKTNPQIA
ncbi:MAG: hypothetical protein JOZ73_14370, partial [Solirubrobacterales bacterium]|nr:hypothetical protein [Solirubrobacterales bacterium]